MFETIFLLTIQKRLFVLLSQTLLSFPKPQQIRLRNHLVFPYTNNIIFQHVLY